MACSVTMYNMGNILDMRRVGHTVHILTIIIIINVTIVNVDTIITYANWKENSQDVG